MIQRESWDSKGHFYDMIWLIFIKILPRILFIFIFMWLYIYKWDDDFVYFVTMALFSFVIFYFFPPSFTVITIIKKDSDIDSDLIKYQLYKAAINENRQTSGVYTVHDSFLIKSYYQHTISFAKILMQKHSLDEPEFRFILQSYNKRAFKNAYYNLCEDVSRKLIADIRGIDEAYGLSVRHQKFWNIKADS